MLKILYSPPSADLCGAAIRSLAESGGRAFLIVPRHYSHECERRLCETLGDTASRSVEVLSIDRLHNRVATEVRGAAERFVDDAGKLLLTYSAAQKVATMLRIYGAEIRKADFLEKASAMIDELGSCCVDSAALMAASERSGGDLADKLHDLALLSEAYAAELGRHSLRPDRVSALCELLRESGWAKDKTFAFYGYTEFTAAELELLRVLLDSRELTISLDCELESIDAELGELDPLFTYGRTVGQLRRLAASVGARVSIDRTECDSALPDALAFVEREFLRSSGASFGGDASPVEIAYEISIWNECERAAGKILEFVRENGLRFRDIAVALPEDDSYRAAVEAVFGSWGIPIFLDRTDAASSAPMIAAVSAVLDVLRGGFATEDLLRYLKSGLSPLDFSAACELENYAYTWSISGSAWLRDFVGNPRGFSVPIDERDIEKLKRLQASRHELIDPLVRFREHIRPGEVYSADEHLRSLYELFSELRLDRHIDRAAREAEASGELQQASEYAQLWDKLCDLIDEFSELAGDEPMRFDEFSQLFELLLDGVQVGSIPPSLDEVALGDPGRLRHRSPKALFLLGALAGNFPPPIDSFGLLDDREREALSELELGLEPSSRKLTWRSLNAAYAALTLPRERLCISYSPSAEGGAPALSHPIARLADALGVAVQPPLGDERLLAARRSAIELALRPDASASAKAAAEYFRRVGEPPALTAARAASSGDRGPICAASAEALFGTDARLTASRSDLFKGCAFSHFMRYGLRADPRKPFELDALESGTLLHSVLENTVRRINSEGHFPEKITDADRAAAQRIASEELRRYIDERIGDERTARTEHLFGRIEKGLERVVSSIMDEFAASDFRPAGFEVGFGTDSAALKAVQVGENGRLVGVIDRVDSWIDPAKNVPYFRVIDYKSGKKQFDYTDIFHGVSLQLPIYLHALRAFAEESGKAADAAGAFYSPAAEPVWSGDRGADDDSVRLEVEKQERRSGVYLSDPEVVRALEHDDSSRFLPTSSQFKLTARQFGLLEQHVAAQLEDTAQRIKSGEIDAKPSRRGQYSACDWCDYRAACRFDSTNGRDAELLRATVAQDAFWENLEEKYGALVAGEEDPNAD